MFKQQDMHSSNFETVIPKIPHHKCFIETKSNRILSLDEIKIVYKIDNLNVGYIYLLKIIPHTYVIHSFYIIPEQRNRGYGTELLTYTCSLAEKMNAKKILIQPGPFELNGKTMHRKEYLIKIQKLITFYQKTGFQPAPLYLTISAKILYKMLRITENATNLHVMNF